MNLELLLRLDYPLTRLIIGLLGVYAFVGINALVLVWVERKVAGHVQLRPGPLHVGPHGLLQTVLDAVKLMASSSSPRRAATRSCSGPRRYWPSRR